MTFWMVNMTQDVKILRKFAKKEPFDFTKWNNIIKFKRIFAPNAKKK